MNLFKISAIFIVLIYAQTFWSFAYSQEKRSFNKSETCYSNKKSFVDCKTADGNFNVIINYKKEIVTVDEYDVYKITSHTNSQPQTVIKAIHSSGTPYLITIDSKAGWITFTDETLVKRIKLYSVN